MLKETAPERKARKNAQIKNIGNITNICLHFSRPFGIITPEGNRKCNQMWRTMEERAESARRRLAHAKDWWKWEPHPRQREFFCATAQVRIAALGQDGVPRRGRGDAGLG